MNVVDDVLSRIGSANEPLRPNDILLSLLRKWMCRAHTGARRQKRKE